MTIGELWAVAITLRFALVENVRGLLAQLIVVARKEHEADNLADELLELANTRPNEVLPVLIKRLGRRTTLGSAYVEQLTRQLRDQDLSIAAGYKWLSNRLNKQGSSIHEIVDSGYQGQAVPRHDRKFHHEYAFAFNDRLELRIRPTKLIRESPPNQVLKPFK